MKRKLGIFVIFATLVVGLASCGSNTPAVEETSTDSTTVVVDSTKVDSTVVQ